MEKTLRHKEPLKLYANQELQLQVNSVTVGHLC